MSFNKEEYHRTNVHDYCPECKSRDITIAHGDKYCFYYVCICGYKFKAPKTISMLYPGLPDLKMDIVKKED